jgi:hypothetical protein
MRITRRSFLGAAATTLGTNLSTWYGNMGTKVNGWAGSAS